MTNKINLAQVLKAYDYANNHPHSYLRGTTNWCAAVAHSLNEQAAPEAPRQEPVAWVTVVHDKDGIKYRSELTAERIKPEFLRFQWDTRHIESFSVQETPLYAAPLSPDHSGGGTGVVLPKPEIFRIPVSGEWFYGTKEQCEREYAEYTADFTAEDFDEDGPAKPEPLVCLDKVKELNYQGHASDCSTNNRGVPELLGPCDCELSKRTP